MKAKFSLLVIAALFCMKMNGQGPGSAVTDLLLSAYSERAYTNDPVTDGQLDIILGCGIKTPSAMNAQPWKFTVIKDENTMGQIIKDIIPGNVIIIVSGLVGRDGRTSDFDCGLAAENMFIAAHGLGLGARIYGSPARILNANRDLYQIPEGYNAIVALRIGNTDKTVDAVSSASPRKQPAEIVNYKK